MPQSAGRNNLIVKFLWGARGLIPPLPLTVLPWDLSRVLRALRDSPFEWLLTTELQPLLLKTALLLDQHQSSELVTYSRSHWTRLVLILDLITVPFMAFRVEVIALPTLPALRTSNCHI